MATSRAACALVLTLAASVHSYDFPFNPKLESLSESMREKVSGHGDALVEEIHTKADERSRRGVIGKLEGTFVSECQVNSTLWGHKKTSGDDTANTSIAFTSTYEDRLHDAEGDFLFEIDYTEYEGNNCDPDKSQIFSKFNMKGIIKFHGKSPLSGKDPKMMNAYQAEWVPTSSVFYFPPRKSVYSQDNQLKKYLKDLNAQCPCKKAKGTWAQGSWRNISAGDCKLDPDVKYPWLCLIANGSTTYGTYRWNDIGKQNVKSYSAGVVQFNQQDGYSSPPASAPRYQLPNGGNNNPQSCNPEVWFTCGNGIQEAANFCYGCQGLECTGCLYRYQEEDVKSPNFWQTCCPCDWAYAARPGQPDWLKVRC